MNKPTFNVCEPFQGTFAVMLDDDMRTLVSQVIHELDDPIEPEVRAFGLALYNPRKSAEIRRQRFENKDPEDFGMFSFFSKPTFNVSESFKGTFIVLINDPMRVLLSRMIHELEDPVEREVRAFGLALHDPQKATQIRRQKYEAKAG
jgi:hypothetical protein